MTTPQPPPKPPSLATTILSASHQDFDSLVQKHAKHKSRSHWAHHEAHLPALSGLPPNSLKTVLLGDSRLERFSWIHTSSRMNQLEDSFNAGVGGDKIENVLYRISEGLLGAMADKMPKLWVVSVGTNNLRPKGETGLKDDEVDAFVVLLAAVLRAAPGSRVLMTEVSYRTDIGDAIVNVVNEQLRDAVQNMNEAAGEERVLWHSLPELRKEEHLLDHVHFNEEGYRMWDEKLVADVKTLLEKKVK